MAEVFAAVPAWPPRARSRARALQGPRGRRRTALVLWTVTLALPASVAWAVWSASGTGDGAARARTAQALTLTAGTAAADLYPGATGVVAFSAANPNPYAVTITGGSVSAITGITGAAGSCTASDFTLSSGTVSGTSVPAGGSATVVVSGAITMKSSAGDGCQGAVVAVTGSVTGSQ